MGTVKPKLQGYVREDLFIQFEDERRALGLSQSQALEKMLSERYKTPSAAANSPDRESLYWIIKSIEDLQERLKKLEISGNLDSNLESESLSNLDSNLESESLSNLDSNLESESLSNLDSNLESESLSNLDSNLESESLSNLDSNPESESLSNLDSNPESESLSNLDSNLESDSLSNLDSNLESESLSNLESESLSNLESESLSNLPNKSKLAKGLGQRALAKRLGCSYKIIGDFVILGSITAWSQRQDPEGLAWELRDKKYYPVACK